MMILEINDLTISVQADVLAEIDHLEIHEGDHIGLIGKNGTGKTTLLNTLIGEHTADKGEIKSYTSIELLPQLKAQTGRKSGGETTQQYIQQAFANQAELLLADEPTTHLDTKHIEWVEKTLRYWKGAFVVVSHDRAFLDKVCNKIWEIDQEKIQEFKGNYQQYKEQKDLEVQQQQLACQKYQDKKQQLEKAITLKSEKATRATKKPKNVSTSEASITGAKPYFAKKQKKMQQTAKALETRLEKLEKVEKPFDEKPLRMTLPNQHKLAHKVLIQVDNLNGSIGNRVLWNKANFQVKHGDKVAITGMNGSGKTTLLQKLLSNEDGVQISAACQIAYFKQDLSLLNAEKSILENVKEGSPQDETMIRTVLARLHFYRDDVHKKVHVLSGGERVKVTLAKIFLSDSNTLILDEPTNFLDIQAMEALERLLIEYEGTLLFVSHDRRFVEKIATRTIAIKDKQVQDGGRASQDFQKQPNPSDETKDKHDQLLAIETRITDVLSRLSIEPTQELEEEFQQLLKTKQKLEG
ncbi:ABC-F type ribosomal protection protein [Gracilibacillus caseinilyticus]|uniref:ABC-F type ribosomal protection protein n=1 Tax=Gracilibacillus caseinilyticus TaxID=2932256 RepID=A0ABY4F022_9BACI|nr:ABC-F type ribosomal protection protein [Gracilibacillus caseinilyticus]UOQ49259.1 ABC-F type ribosomal protection protein [Gracilibacillus caseinilyticus]